MSTLPLQPRHFGKSVTYVGDGDTAHLVRICYLFVGVVSQSLAEITVLAERGGVPRAAFLKFRRDRLGLHQPKSPAQLVQACVSSGRVTEDFAILLDLQAASSGLELKPENIVVDDGLGASDGLGGGDKS